VKEYVLDANAVIRFIQNQAGAEAIGKLIAKAQRNEAKLSISAINLGEVLYTLAKSIGLEKTSAYMLNLSQAVETVPVDEEFALAAATLKFHYKLGYADSMAGLLAMRRRATLVTADPEFSKLGKKLKLLTLPRHGA